MARSESKRQKRLAKQKAKRNQKRQDLTRMKSMGLAEQLTRFDSAPFLDCLVNNTFEEQGLASLFIARKAPTGELAIGVFLVDIYCMGVKNCFGKLLPFAEYRKELERYRGQGVRPMDPPSARRLIEDAVAFAASVGLSPHPAYHKVRPILNGIDPDEAKETFPMGKDGKPFFVAGPSQSPEECRRIMAKIQSHCGPNGSHFMLPVSGGDALPPGIGFDDLDDEDFDENEELDDD